LGVLVTLSLAPAGLDQPSPPKPAADPPPKSVPPLGEPSPEFARLLTTARQIEEDRRRTGAAILKRLQTQPLIPRRWEHSGYWANTAGLLALAGGAVEKQYLTSIEWEDGLLALGDLRYEPAVGLMIENITTKRAIRKVEDTIITNFPPTHVSYPAIRALWGVGQPAVKPLLKADLPRKAAAIKKGDKEPDRTRDEFLWNIDYTLGHHSMAGEAILRLEALAERNRLFTDDDEDEIRAINALLEKIQEEQRRWR
jgi:hypothetical protein